MTSETLVRLTALHAPPWALETPRALLRRLEAAGKRGNYQLGLLLTATATQALRDRAAAWFAGQGTPVDRGDLRALDATAFASAALHDADQVLTAWWSGGDAFASDRTIQRRRHATGSALYIWGRLCRTYAILATPPLLLARAELAQLIQQLPADLGWTTAWCDLRPGGGGLGLADYVLVRVQPNVNQSFLALRLHQRRVEKLLQEQESLLRSASGRKIPDAIAWLTPRLRRHREQWIGLIRDFYVAPPTLVEWDHAFAHQMGAASLPKALQRHLKTAIPSFREIIKVRAARFSPARPGAARVSSVGVSKVSGVAVSAAPRAVQGAIPA